MCNVHGSSCSITMGSRVEVMKKKPVVQLVGLALF